MKKGYEVFGKAFEIMNRNDLHDINSIDHKFMQEMILLDESSYEFLYKNKVNYYNMENHELYDFSKQFKGTSNKETIINVLSFTRNIVKNFNVEFEDMLFGGTEKQIIYRGTDWCADISRVAAVILDCLSIPCRILHLANIDKAYNGHVVIEAYYENKWGVIDPLYGYMFYESEPLDAYQLMNKHNYLCDYEDYYKDLYRAIAINEYNPMDKSNNYNISKPNEYYLKLINSSHNDNWIMYENVILHCISKTLWDKVKNNRTWGKELLEKEGFIHCSTIEYFWRVAPNFKDVKEDLLLLVIDENKLTSLVKYEDGDNYGRAYPHVYGEITNDAIINVLPFIKDENNNWIKNEEFKFIENK